ncbi:MAG: EamA family transporter [Hyphomicrobiales bacterium]|nr:MAG: EamA family transporter [Hyphomicrobiales bacterium]
MTPREWALLTFLSIIWGGAFFFVAVAVHVVPPLTVVFLRVGIAALALLLYLQIKGEKLQFERSLLLAFLVMGMLNNIIPFSLLFWAQTNISSGLASILNATTPMFSIIVAHFALADEKMAANKIIGVFLGLFGVMALVGGSVIEGENIAIFGMIACLGAALSYACAATFGRRFRTMDVSNSYVAFGQLTASTLVMIPVMLIVDRPWELAMPGTGVVLAIVALALISTALAYVIYFQLLASVGAVNVALVTLLVPVSAILLGTIFLNEILETRHYVGLALILTGLIAVDGRLLRKSTTGG